MAMLILTFFLLLLVSLIDQNNSIKSCNEVESDSLLWFNHHLSSPRLNWSRSTHCCDWEGISCGHGIGSRVTHLWLAEKDLYGTIDLITNLSFLAHINLSHNRFSGPFNLSLFHSFKRLRTLDLSFNHLSGQLQTPLLSSSIRTLDLSSNRFNGSMHPSFLDQASNLMSFNVSNNTITGSIPSSICKGGAPRMKIIDFSSNQFRGGLSEGVGECRNLEVFRAGSNSLDGWIPYDLFKVKTLKELSLPNNRLSGPINSSIVMLSNLRILKLHVNELSGNIPSEIGLLSKLQQLQLHSNSLNGSLPPSLMDCSKLTTLLLRNNHFGGEAGTLDFSQLRKLEAVDLGNNSFVGNIPNTLCSCQSLKAVRLAYNQLVGEVPACFTSLTSLKHLSLSDNNLSNVVGALTTLRHCENLAVLFMSRCFHEEMMPDDKDLDHLRGFQNLQILTIGGCKLKGQIPSWISKLTKLKVLNLSYNRISGQIPTWLGDMPNLYVLNLTQNFLSGQLPRELGGMQALIADNSSTDLSSLALPFLFNSLQYDRLFNMPRGLKVGHNSLSGNIPEEIGRLKLLHVLDLSSNEFNGSIPRQLSHLTDLEKLDMSGNHLSGEIPESLMELHFLSSFNVAHNDLGGEIPRGGQFDTFSAASFEANPKLCGYLIRRPCPLTTQVDHNTKAEPEHEHESSIWYTWPFGLGYFVGVVAVSITRSYKTFQANN